ncbi:MAG: hypothetical protein ABIJ39_10350 [Chloroflexota bacterium]
MAGKTKKGKKPGMNRTQRQTLVMRLVFITVSVILILSWIMSMIVQI